MDYERDQSTSSNLGHIVDNMNYVSTSLKYMGVKKVDEARREIENQNQEKKFEVVRAL